MEETRKITIEVLKSVLENAQARSGEGVSETVRAALKSYGAPTAQQKLRKLRGTYKFSVSLDELREDRK